jgi:RNA polymerase sigma-70 factor (ECF subfamily)
VSLPSEGAGDAAAPAPDGEAEARILIERFRRDRLPAAWQPVFELRFVRQLSQGQAAGMLRLSRTTLAYRELRIRHALKTFLLEAET